MRNRYKSICIEMDRYLTAILLFLMFYISAIWAPSRRHQEEIGNRGAEQIEKTF